MAQDIARQLEARGSFRIVQKRTIQRVRRAGAKGIKTLVSGRLNGAENARSEGYKDGIIRFIPYALILITHLQKHTQLTAVLV